MKISTYIKMTLSTENTSAPEPPRDEALVVDAHFLPPTESEKYTSQHPRIEHRNTVDTFAIFHAIFPDFCPSIPAPWANFMITLSSWLHFLITSRIYYSLQAAYVLRSFFALKVWVLLTSVLYYVIEPYWH